MKVTLIVSPPDAGHHTELKLTLPTKWLEGKVERVKKSFIQAYTAKHPEEVMKEENMHLSTMEGVDIADTDVVAMTFKPGQEVMVRKGSAPLHSPFSQPSVAESKTTTTKPTPSPSLPSAKTTTTRPTRPEHDVTTKEGLEEAKKASQHDFDYSKWNKLDLSDDDGDDCHPNIELASWKRIKKQQRADRRQKEEEELKRLEEIVRLNKQKADELNLAIERSGGGTDQMNVDRAAAFKATRHAMETLEKFKSSRKWIADDVCDTKEDRTVIATKSSSAQDGHATSKVGPVKAEAELDSYDDFVAKHEQTLRMFVSIDNNREETEKFMLEHPEILCSNADGYLLLLCLDDAMKRVAVADTEKKPQQLAREKAMAMRLVRQHLLLNYVLELAKVSHADDVRAAVKPFFFKTGRQSKEQIKEFEGEMAAFLQRIENRARDKLAAGEKSPLSRFDKNAQQQQQEEEYEPAGLGPGGLDPNEVLGTLPTEMQEAFVEQDVPKLRAILRAMEPDLARHHLDRCIASGLWVPGPHDAEGDDDDDDDDEADQAGGDQQHASPAAASAANAQ